LLHILPYKEVMTTFQAVFWAVREPEINVFLHNSPKKEISLPVLLLALRQKACYQAPFGGDDGQRATESQLASLLYPEEDRAPVDPA
jgi:hypothetical protein